MAIEERIGNHRLDVLVTFCDDGRSASQELVVEAKVGAVVEARVLAEYLAKVQARTGLASGLLVAPYRPVGALPSGWAYQDLRDVTDQLSCPIPGETPPCAICQEITFAVEATYASDRVAEWRALTTATTRTTNIPGDWTRNGSGSSVGRPLVWFESPWLDAKENSYVTVEAGNYYGSPRASAMLVASAQKEKEKVVFPDKLWKALVCGYADAPALPLGVTDASPQGRGAKDKRAASDARRHGVPASWSLGFNMKDGGHRRGRVLRHVNDDFGALLPAAIQQGVD